MEAVALSSVRLIDVPPSLARPDLERRLPTGPRFQDLTGVKSDHCEVVGFVGYLKRYSVWLCNCECGNQFLARCNQFSASTAKERRPACGCRNRTHGATGSPLYNIWAGILQRCYNPNSPSYRNYGERGIAVCRRWRESYEAFAEDMGDRPTDDHSIDRIDNDGNYCKENCRWATQREQTLNSAVPTWVEYGGERLCLSQWGERIGLSRERIRQRVNTCIELGADISEAVATPAGETMPCLAAAIARRKTAKAELAISAVERATLAKPGHPPKEIAELLDGSVRYTTAENLIRLAGAKYEIKIRNYCTSLGLKPRFRALENHILFQAVPR